MPILMSDVVKVLNDDVKKATGHKKEGVGVAVCGGKRKRRRKATKRLEKREGKREEESLPSSPEKAHKAVARPHVGDGTTTFWLRASLSYFRERNPYFSYSFAQTCCLHLHQPQCRPRRSSMLVIFLSH
jgi:hypothetical protein